MQGGSGEEGGEVVPDTEEEQQVVQAQVVQAHRRMQAGMPGACVLWGVRKPRQAALFPAPRC